VPSSFSRPCARRLPRASPVLVRAPGVANSEPLNPTHSRRRSGRQTAQSNPRVCTHWLPGIRPGNGRSPVAAGLRNIRLRPKPLSTHSDVPNARSKNTSLTGYVKGDAPAASGRPGLGTCAGQSGPVRVDALIDFLKDSRLVSQCRDVGMSREACRGSHEATERGEGPRFRTLTSAPSSVSSMLITFTAQVSA